MADTRFRIDELIHSGELYDIINDFDRDLPFYLSWAKAANGAVLELCCGTGRLTLALSEAGIDITGLDLSDVMLARAREKAVDRQAELEWVRGDMRSFSLDRQFGLIFIPFNSLQCLYAREDIEQVFTRVRRHLLPGGRFIVDIFNPDITRLLGTSEWQPVCRLNMPDGRPLIVDETNRYDAVNQVNRVVWRHRIGGEIHEAQLDMHCFFPQEMDALLVYNGFELLHKFGDYDRSAFGAASPKQLYVCKVAGD